MPNTIHMQVEVTDQFLLDVMTNAVETGACGYWAAIQLVMRNDRQDIYEFQVADLVDTSDMAQDLRDEGTKESEIPEIIENKDDLWVVIDGNSIVNGINRVLTPEFTCNWDIKEMIMRAVSEGEADIDAIGCDVIVQAAAFGEIVYG